MNKVYTAESAAIEVIETLKLFNGRWKLNILFHLFDGKVQRYSDFEKLIPEISQKMLTQQLKQLQKDGLIIRVSYAQIPIKVEYQLTEWGNALCPVLDGLLKWKSTQL